MGWIEGFKAVSDIYCVATGEFLRANPALDSEPDDYSPRDRDGHGTGVAASAAAVPNDELAVAVDTTT